MSQSHVTDELPNKEQIQSQSKKIQDRSLEELEL